MADAIDVLIREHRVIEEVLSSLEAFIEKLGEFPERERDCLREYARFFHEYVDKCHHGKEEDYLFVKMNAYGFSKKTGPVSAMLSEQGEGREHLNALAEVGQGEGLLGVTEREIVKGHALAYVMRIRLHMQREEDILFPMATHALPRFILEELSGDFRLFEEKSLPHGFHEKLQSISKSLLAAYPPMPGQMKR